MTKKILVYGLFDPDTQQLRYVGKSSCGIRRAKMHSYPSVLRSEQHLPKSRWIAKLLRRGVTYEICILEECEKEEELNEAERFNIAYYRSIGCDLLNICPGGEGGGHKNSEYQIQCVRNALTGLVRPPETRARMREAQLRRQQEIRESPELIARVSAVHKQAAILRRIREGKNVISEEQRAEVLRLYNHSSMSHRAIASLVGLCHASVSLILQESGIHGRRLRIRCYECHYRTLLNSNGVCKKCNLQNGLRQCTGKCQQILPALIGFYEKKAICKACSKKKGPG